LEITVRNDVPIRVQDTIFYITSGLSSGSDHWCLYGANNSVLPGSVLAIHKCQNWNSFKWVIDYEGKIRNYKNLNVCVSMSGSRVTLDYCVDGKPAQKWIYNSNGSRFLSFVNGLKALKVENGIAATKAQVKVLSYDWIHDSEIWFIQYDFDYLSLSQRLIVPFYDNFRIVSHLTRNDGSSFCVFPANNSPVEGMKIAISRCRSWKSFIWMWDSYGKLINAKDPTMCITSFGFRLQMAHCDDRSVSQRFSYSVVEHKLLSLRHGKRQVVVYLNDGVRNDFHNSQVKFTNQERNMELAESGWTLEQF